MLNLRPLHCTRLPRQVGYLVYVVYRMTMSLLQANEITKFENILPDHDHVKAALSSDLPVVLGLTLYESFVSREVAKTGMMSARLAPSTLDAPFPSSHSRARSSA